MGWGQQGCLCPLPGPPPGQGRCRRARSTPGLCPGCGSATLAVALSRLWLCPGRGSAPRAAIPPELRSTGSNSRGSAQPGWDAHGVPAVGAAVPVGLLPRARARDTLAAPALPELSGHCGGLVRVPFVTLSRALLCQHGVGKWLCLTRTCRVCDLAVLPVASASPKLLRVPPARTALPWGRRGKQGQPEDGASALLSPGRASLGTAPRPACRGCPDPRQIH